VHWPRKPTPASNIGGRSTEIFEASGGKKKRKDSLSQHKGIDKGETFKIAGCRKERRS